MPKPKLERATVILPWSTPEQQGLLVHADRYKNTWIFPGGRIEQDLHELPIAAAIRERR